MKKELRVKIHLPTEGLCIFENEDDIVECLKFDWGFELQRHSYVNGRGRFFLIKGITLRNYDH